jgi:DNA-binding CsgD family transcriptional regulator
MSDAGLWICRQGLPLSRALPVKEFFRSLPANRKLLFRAFSIYCLLVSTCAAAQELPGIRNFSPAVYGAQAQNWSVAQSPAAGWMYFGNNAGLMEFDGARWRQYSLPEKQTVRAVACGPDGKVYCGGFAEFGYWQKDESGKMVYTSLSRNVHADNLAKEEIWHILFCKDFVLFQSFSTIYKYDGRQVTVLKPPGAIMFVQQVGNRLLFQVIGRGIFELLTDNTFRIIPGTEPLADKIVQFIIPDGQASFWAGTTNDGIWMYETGKVHPWSHPMNAEFRRYQLNKAVTLHDGSRVIGTILNGIYWLGPDGALRARLNRETGLQNNTVLALFEDKSYNLWLGLDRGIDYVEVNSPLTFFNDQTGKIGAVYTAALFQKRLYVGSNQGVFVKEWPAHSSGFQLVEGTQGQVWQLKVVDNQLICGHNDGTFLIDGTKAQKISSITGGWCTRLVPGQPDALVQGTYTGLAVFRKSNSGQWAFSHKVSGFLESLRKIEFDSLGYLWGVHPNRGLYRLRLSADLKQIQEQKLFTTADGLPSEIKMDLAKLGNQVILNLEHAPRRIAINGQSVRFDTFPPPLNRTKVLPGTTGDFFLPGNNTLRCLFGSRLINLPVSLVQGYENIVLLEPDHYLFCEENGYAILDRKRQQDGAGVRPEGPSIRQVALTGERPGILPASPVQDIPYRQNSLKFFFATPVFDQVVKYSWQLDGFTNSWSDWQSTAEKEFASLPPGGYTFRVRTDASDAEATFSFRILPPWYLSGWALFCYALSLIAALLIAEQFSRRRLARQRSQLEAEKEQDLARHRAEAEREMLSLELENKSRELSNAALGLIRKNEILLKIKDDLLAAKGDTRAIEKLSRLIDSHIESDHDWQIFESSFNQVHDDFFKKLMAAYPDLTPGDLRLAAYLKMNLASKEIAPLFNISLRGVENKRYRLRKKLGLPEDANLTEFMMNF